MKKIRIVAAAVLACVAATAVFAQQEPQAVRQDLMKGIGRSVGTLGGIAKGEQPYDMETVRDALTTINTNIQAFPDYFPEGSESGLETEAKPDIWSKKDDFHAKARELEDVSSSLLADLPSDRQGVQQAVQAIGPVCGDCHESYRVKR
jgi:cytochrome c556